MSGPLVALTIAGSDSGGGAGIQQDLAVFSAFGLWGLSAVTAVTVQDTTGIRGIHSVPPQIVAAQIDAVCADSPPAAAKTGMLAGAQTLSAVCDALARNGIGRVVVDPVLAASDSTSLLDPEALGIVRERLIPMAAVVTPNAPEAAALTGIRVTDEAGQRAAAEALVAMGAQAALVTGGHLPGDAVDVWAGPDGTVLLTGPRIEGEPVHGTGCVLSAAIAAGLAAGAAPIEAARAAKRFVEAAIRGAIPIGAGARVADVRALRPAT